LELEEITRNLYDKAPLTNYSIFLPHQQVNIVDYQGVKYMRSMPTMALGIALAATPQCRTGTPVSEHIRSGFHVGQVASWMAIQSLN